MAEVAPGVAVSPVVFADGSPLAFAEEGPHFFQSTLPSRASSSLVCSVVFIASSLMLPTTRLRIHLWRHVRLKAGHTLPGRFATSGTCVAQMAIDERHFMSDVTRWLLPLGAGQQQLHRDPDCLLTGVFRSADGDSRCGGCARPVARIRSWRGARNNSPRRMRKRPASDPE